MAKQGSRGSITQQKKRYNDDYYLGSENGNTPIVVADTTLSEISNNNDWSISFSMILTNSGTFQYALHCRGTEGWAIRVTPSTTFLLVYFQTNNGGGQTRYLYTVNTASFDTLNSYVFSFDSITKELSLFVDSHFISSQAITTAPFQNNGINTGAPDGKLDIFRPSYSTVGGVFDGGLKDVATFDKQLTTSERKYIYEKGVLPKNLVENDNCEFYMPLNHVAYNDGGVPYMLDMVNSVRKTPKTSVNGEMTGWSFDELGLNIGTSTFTAYEDFYTKVAGQNFTGGGDIVNYKSKELRKFGLTLNGIDQYLTILNDTPTDEKGYTTIIVYKTDASGYLLHKSNGVDEFKEEVNAVNEEHISHYPSVSAQETMTLPYANTDSFQGLNFVTIKQGSTKTQGNPNTNGVISLNVSQEITATGLALGKSYNTIGGNTVIGANYLGASNFFDGSICYFARFKGVLDNEEAKRLLNNMILRNSNDLSPNTKSDLDLFIDFNNPFDDVGTLKFNDLSPNNRTITVQGFANIAALEASKVENLSLV